MAYAHTGIFSLIENSHDPVRLVFSRLNVFDPGTFAVSTSCLLLLILSYTLRTTTLTAASRRYFPFKMAPLSPSDAFLHKTPRHYLLIHAGTERRQSPIASTVRCKLVGNGHTSECALAARFESIDGEVDKAVEMWKNAINVVSRHTYWTFCCRRDDERTLPYPLRRGSGIRYFILYGQEGAKAPPNISSGRGYCKDGQAYYFPPPTKSNPMISDCHHSAETGTHDAGLPVRSPGSYLQSCRLNLLQGVVGHHYLSDSKMSVPGLS